MTVASTVKLYIMIPESQFIILALADIDDARVIIYATIWNIPYDCNLLS
jgi:hypothetical protein